MPEQVQEAAGAGLEGVVAGRQVRLGGLAWVWPEAVPKWAEDLVASRPARRQLDRVHRR